MPVSLGCVGSLQATALCLLRYDAVCATTVAAGAAAAAPTEAAPAGLGVGAGAAAGGGRGNVAGL